MTNMVSYNEAKEINLVDARMLHDFLGIGKDFSTWIKDTIAYGFEENTDYFEFSPISGKTSKKGGRPRKEYA